MFHNTFINIAILAYVLYFAVNFLIDLTRQKKSPQPALVAGSKKIDFVIAEPQHVIDPSPKNVGNNETTEATGSAASSPVSRQNREEEQKNILMDIGLERIPDGGINVTEDNLLTIINRGM